MNERVYDLINKQINAELYSAYLYLSFAEKLVTSLINDIYTAAREVNDYRAMKFLDWFSPKTGFSR